MREGSDHRRFGECLDYVFSQISDCPRRIIIGSSGPYGAYDVHAAAGSGVRVSETAE